jgi:RNA polymerase sigma-70 factor, ECF subfamily
MACKAIQRLTVYREAPHPPDPSDELLVARVQQRDRAAFTLLYDRHAPVIYALAAHLLNPTDAEEVVQEVFLRLWRRAEQFDPERGSFKPWLLTVARNYIFDQLKRGAHEQRLAALDGINELLADAANPETAVAEVDWSQQRQAAMLVALRDLPAEQRRAIVLAYFGGMSQSAIAEQLGWPLGTVKKRLRLGLQKLRAALAPWRELT